MAEQTIRGMVNERLDKVYNHMNNLPPGELEKIASELARLMPNINDVITTLEGECAKQKLKLVTDEDMTAAKANIIIEASEDYQEVKKLKGMYKAMDDQIKIIKYRLRRLEKEYENIK